MSNRTKKKTMKLITGILIPIFIMVSSIVMVGVSYAWFSPSADAGISTINMVSEEAFTLTFAIQSHNPTSLENRNEYAGQQAFYPTRANDTHLVTEKYAQHLELSGNAYEEYLLDAPYDIGTQIRLNTENKEVDFEIYVNSVVIRMETRDPNNPSIITNNELLLVLTHQDQLIEYGFTWYLVDQSGEYIYTPYGIQYQSESDSNANANKLKITGENESLKTWASTPVKQEIRSFRANNALMTLHIVFCPEKLYWMQYSKGKSIVNDNTTEDWLAYMNQVYGNTDLDKIYHLDSYKNNGDTTGATYWDASYVGATFEFDFTVNVKNVHK